MQPTQAPKKRKVELPGGESRAAPQGPSSADAARKGLVTVNKLDYELSPDLSVCVSRSNKIHHFSQNAYTPGQRMICVINSGAEYIRPDRSYLEFEVKNNGVGTNPATNFYLGQGGATNFLKDLVITGRSGDECERVLDVNRLTAFIVKATHSKEKLNTTGRLAGFSTKSTHLVRVNEDPYAARGKNTNGNFVRSNIDRTSNHGSSEFVKIKPGETMKFLIPLSMISGIFKFDRLLPSMFMSGLRFDFLLETAAKAVLKSSTNESILPGTGTGTTPGAADTFNTPAPNGADANWSVLRPRIILDSYQLTDSVQRVLNEEAATRGLELVFKSWHTTQFSITGSQRVETTLQMRKAVSRALSILTVMYPKDEGAQRENQDYFANIAWDVIETQLRIGSLYFPQQPIRDKTGYLTARECYYHFLRAAGKLGYAKQASGITFEQFVGPYIVKPSETAVGEATYLPMPQNWLKTVPVVNGNPYKDLSNDILVTKYVDDKWNDGGIGRENTDVTVPMNGIWWDLERSNVTEMTGIPINNSRVAEVSITIDGGPTEQGVAARKLDRDAYVYLCYVRLLRVFLQNIEVEE
jgi:hypothetical protein